MTPPSLHDPHNLAPELTPDDDWGDHEGVEVGGIGVGSVLPPRKQRSQKTSGNEEPVDGGGLRIGTRNEPALASPGRAATRLEVEEIDGTVTRLEASLPPPSLSERPAVFVERPKGGRSDPKHRGEQREWGLRPKGSVRWLVGTGFGIAALVVLALMALPRINRANSARPDAAMAVAGPAKPDDEEIRIRELMTARPLVEPLVKDFLTCGVADDMLRLVRESGEVESLIRAARRGPLVPSSWEPPAASEWLVHSLDGGMFGLMLGSLPDFTPFRIFVTKEDGRFYIDWKASTAYSTANFEELAMGSGDASEVRGVLEATTFYTRAFPEEDFLSYRLDSPDGDRSLWVYVRRDSPAAGDVSEIFASGAILTNEKTSARVTLRLRRGSEDALANQWEIETLRSTDWIEIDPDNE